MSKFECSGFSSLANTKGNLKSTLRVLQGTKSLGGIGFTLSYPDF